MSLFTYHLVKISFFKALKMLLFPPKPRTVPGLVHAEVMTVMTLGAPVFSPARLLLRQVAVFAQWTDDASVDQFLAENKLGQELATGWHTRLQFVRQWGRISGFNIPEPEGNPDIPEGPVVAVTIARMKLPEIPRFIRWGRPTEQLVRDHPGTTLSLASIRFPRTVSTFSIWKSQQEMTDMVRGHSAVPRPNRHLNAMRERDRKDFHFEFTTLRFRPLTESGEWKRHRQFIPGL
ncbi:MAG: hypothetical protein EOP52_12535 [Sphingobacteriales bacterium]|nr:MAG: hypothetical protein EOP52_12535 [Sphingobacteriales bacterium]